MLCRNAPHENGHPGVRLRKRERPKGPEEGSGRASRAWLNELAERTQILLIISMRSPSGVSSNAAAGSGPIKSHPSDTLLYVVIHHHALHALERHVRTIRPPRHPDQQCRHQHRALARRRSTGRKIVGNHAGRVRRVIDVNLVAAFLMTRGADADGCSAGAHHQCHVAKTHAALWRLQGRQRGNSHCAGAGTRRQRRHR